MASLAILNFVLSHFLSSNIRSAAIFNCWPLEAQVALSHLASTRMVFAQLVAIDRRGTPWLERFPGAYLEHRQPQLGVFLDLNCRSSAPLLEKAIEQRLFNAHFRWLVYDGGANMTRFRRFFEDAYLAVDADLTYAAKTAVGREDKREDDEEDEAGADDGGRENAANAADPFAITLYDVYNNGRHIGGRLNVTADRELLCDAARRCRLRRFLSDLHRRTRYRNRCSMRDVTMRMATVVTKVPSTRPEPELLAFLRSTADPAADGIQRFGFQIMSLLIEYLDCNVSYSFTDRWSSGAIFGGALGQLINETADLISAASILTAPRLAHLTPLIETGSFRSVCMFRTPRRHSGIQGGVFLEPFTPPVWLIFAAVLLVAAVLLWSTFVVEARRLRSLGAASWAPGAPSFLTACLVSFGSACFQGTNLIPHSTGGRMLFFSLSLISFIMYNYYTSMVVSSLLGSPVKSGIRTLAQLADCALEVGLEPLSYTYAYLNTSRLAEVRRFVRRKIEARNNSAHVWLPVEEGIKRVRDQPGFVYIFEASTGYSYVERFYEPHQICDLNEFLLRSERSIYTHVSKTSSYREVIRLKTLRLLESGVYLKHYRYWIRTRLHCFANNFVIEVGMEYAAPLFFMLLSSYVLVLVVLLVEIGWERFAKAPAEKEPLRPVEE